MTGAGQWRRIFNTSSVKEQVRLITIWSVYLYIFCRLRNGNFCAPREAFRLDIYLCIFLLIYRKRKFYAEPMRERLTFHFELRTRSGNFRFFFSSFLLSFCFSNQGKISSCNIMKISKKTILLLNVTGQTINCPLVKLEIRDFWDRQESLIQRALVGGGSRNSCWGSLKWRIKDLAIKYGHQLRFPEGENLRQ